MEDLRPILPTRLEIPISVHEDYVPQYATDGSSGADIKAYLRSPVTILPGGTKLIPTGIVTAIPKGYEIQIRPRSGLALRNGVTVINSPGTIDSDYRHEISIILINHGDEPFVVEDGMRIAQMVCSPVVQMRWERTLIENIPGTDRKGGFGSTGV